jgi:hypothetical protein
MLKHTFCLGPAPLDVPAIEDLQPLRALPADLTVCHTARLASQVIFGAVDGGTRQNVKIPSPGIKIVSCAVLGS